MRYVIGTLLIAALSGCSGALSDTASPSEDNGKEVFVQMLEQDIRNTPFTIDSFRKTDGQEVDHFGQKIYRLFYSATVTFPEGYQTGCLEAPPVEEDCRNSGGLRVRGHVNPKQVGEATTYTGKIEFEKRESGWKWIPDEFGGLYD